MFQNGKRRLATKSPKFKLMTPLSKFLSHVVTLTPGDMVAEIVMDLTY